MSQSAWRIDDLANLLAAAELTIWQVGEHNELTPDFKAGYLAALATVARSLGIKTTRPTRWEVVETGSRRLLTEGSRP